MYPRMAIRIGDYVCDTTSGQRMLLSTHTLSPTETVLILECNLMAASFGIRYV